MSGPCRRLRHAAILGLTAVASLALLTSPVGASGGGSGSAGAAGRGSTIISSILWGGRGGGAGGHGGPTPECVWHTLSDLDLVFLVHVAASVPELQEAGLFHALEPWLGSGLAPGLELQVMFCDGTPRSDQVRARPAAVSATEVATAARRQLLTRLPPPALQTSPPAGRPALVNHPVFSWVDPQQWSTPVRSTLVAGATTVEVEAVPTALDVVGGEADSGGRVLRCNGPGERWDPLSALSVEAQAARPGACVLRYTKVTGVQGRRAAWTGYAQLHWDGRYRVDGGPWQPLGPLFSLRVFTRSVREAQTVIEQP